MSDSEKTPSDSSAVEEALSQIPGLADEVGSEPKADSSADWLKTESEEEAGQGVAPPEREKGEDSDAVRAALSQIPGLQDRLGS